jgi:predicted Zn-dependent protease
MRAMCTCRATTRRQLLRLGGAASLPLLGGCDQLPVQLVSDETVEAMGLEAWAALREQTPASGRRDLQAALDGVAARLLRATGEPPEDWEAVVFASPEINAFALPGNKIGVFEGMFEVFGSVDQLAAVVGNEIGHLRADHSQERITAQLGKDLGLRLILLLLRLGEVDYAENIAAALGLGLEYGLLLPYSRRQELEADRLGLELMAAAGFAPEQAVELWRRMDATSGPRLPAFLATHPAPEDRIEAIEAMLPDISGA